MKRALRHADRAEHVELVRRLRDEVVRRQDERLQRIALVAFACRSARLGGVLGVAAPPQPRHDAQRHPLGEDVELRSARRGFWHKARLLAFLTFDVDAVECARVQMDVEIQARPKALHEREGARVKPARLAADTGRDSFTRTAQASRAGIAGIVGGRSPARSRRSADTREARLRRTEEAVRRTACPLDRRGTPRRSEGASVRRRSIFACSTGRRAIRLGS